jgi:hypothetical protein
MVAGARDGNSTDNRINGAWFSHRDLSPRRPHYQAVLRPAEANIVCHFWVRGKRFPPRAMKAIIVKRARVRSIAVAILLCAIKNILAQARTETALNEGAFAFAMQLVKERHFIADGKGMWRGHQPSANEENEFIRLHGFGEYAKWHLGIDEHYPKNTKQRYKFPYGDFKNVHRCAMLAAKARARQYGYTEIENAAAELERAVSTQSKK